MARTMLGLTRQAILGELHEILLRFGRKPRTAVIEIAAHGLAKHVGSIRSRVGGLTGENLAENRSQPEHVGTFIEPVGFAERLFGAMYAGVPMTEPATVSLPSTAGSPEIA